MTKSLLCCLLLIVPWTLVFAQPDKPSVINSPHNMSTSGPGEFKSLTVRRVCVFCHTPHSPSPKGPLWNRSDTGQTYTQYISSTLVAEPGQPSGSSRLCLACHDGTIALEQLAKLPPEARGAQKSERRLLGRSNLGTNLSDDHPISFTYDARLHSSNREIASPTLVPLPMHDGVLRCATCHDPHNPKHEPFLRIPSLNGELCVACHLPAGKGWDWRSSAHARSDARPAGAKPWDERKPNWRGRTVEENSCFNCHAPHNAATPARLMVDEEEKTCYRCHDGGVAQFDIQAEFFKPSRHPVSVTPNLGHDADKVEDPRSMPMHVECADCHNSHAVRKDDPMVTVSADGNWGGQNLTMPPGVNGLIAGVAGLDQAGRKKSNADYQYEVCFKCHGVPGRSACGNSRCTTARVMSHTRVDGVYNLRDKTDPDSNPRLRSYHPITRNNPAFSGSSVPSLRFELGLNTTDTLIFCTDCHNSDESSAGRGTGAEGPHGSAYAPLLAQRYTLRPKHVGSVYSEASLCFKCHNPSVLFSGIERSGYIHTSHLEAGSCITCHDPHGSTAFRHLLNFETNNNLVRGGDSPSITGAGPYSQPTWIATPEGGQCWLQCHSGPEHLGFSYPPGTPDETLEGLTPAAWGEN